MVMVFLFCLGQFTLYMSDSHTPLGSTFRRRRAEEGSGSDPVSVIV